MNNRPILLAGIWYGVAITITLVVLFFIKSSRDERGRAIIGKAMILGVFYALPFVIVFGLLYCFWLIGRVYLLEVSDFSFYIIFIAIIANSVVIYELLHGVGWTVAS